MVYLRNSTIVCLIFILVLSSCSDTSSIVDSYSEGDTSNPLDSEEVTLSFESDSSSFLPGELIIIQVEGIELEKDEYPALLGDDIEVTLKRNESRDDELILLVPEIEVGSHSLSLKNIETLNELEFNVKEYKVIEDPEMYITDMIDEVTLDLESISDEAVDNSIKEMIDGQISDIKEYKNGLSERPADEVKLLARVIETHLVSFRNMPTGENLKLDAGSSDCREPIKDTVDHVDFIARSISRSLSGSVTASWGAAYIGETLVAIGTGMLYSSLELLRKDLNKFWNRCINETVEATRTWVVEVDSSGTRMVNNEQLSFAPGEKRTFYMYSEYEAPSQLQSSLNGLKSLLQTLPQVIPDSWMSVINHDYIFENKEDPSNFSIEEITSENIEAQVQAQDSLLMLEFKYVDDEFVSKDSEFSFNLSSETGIDIAFEAVLAAPPEEFSAVINGKLYETSYARALKTQSTIVGQVVNGIYIGGQKAEYSSGEIKSLGFHIRIPEFEVGSYPSSKSHNINRNNMCIYFALTDGSIEDPSGSTGRCSQQNKESGTYGSVNITSVQNGVIIGDFYVTVNKYKKFGGILKQYVITDGQFRAYVEE